MEWPESASSFIIIDQNSEAQKNKRAMNILSSFIDKSLYDLNFLDFGCGEGHCVSMARAKLSVGYDIIPLCRPDLFNDWEQIKKAKYDIVLLYDVLDHAKNPIEILNRIKEVLAPDGKVYIRCHPYSSRHGGHLYQKDNRAFIHLFENKEIKLPIPHQIYAKWLNETGYNIIKQQTHRQTVEPFIKNKFKELTQWNNKDVSIEKNIDYYSFGKSINPNLVNYGNHVGQTTEVGKYPSNNFGLHDMHGNVWEWCSDWCSNYPDCEQINPTGPTEGGMKCVRGGSFSDDYMWARSAQRGDGEVDRRYNNFGFRCVSDKPKKDFVLIPSGRFMMGSQHDEPFRQGLNRDETPHEVNITKPFYMSKYLTTQKLFKEVMDYNNSINEGDNNPVENVSYNEALEFCQKYDCRLPTESEWEWSCRASTKIALEDILSINFIDYIIANNESKN